MLHRHTEDKQTHVVAGTNVHFTSWILVILHYVFCSRKYSSVSMRQEEKPVMESWPEKRPEDKVVVCGCFPCHRETRDTLREMLDFSLLKDPIFLLFSLSNFCTSIGFYVPYTFIVVSKYFIILFI